MTQEALRMALEALEENHHLIEEHERPEYLVHYDQIISLLAKALAKEKALQALHSENERLGLYKDAYAQPEQEPVAHWSDCAVHSEPAYPKGECDCGGIVAVADYTALSDKYVALSDKYVALKAQRTEQEPVKIVQYNCKCGRTMKFESVHGVVAPQRTWVGLTRMDLIKCGVLPFGMSYELCQAIEAKLKQVNGYAEEKNT